MSKLSFKSPGFEALAVCHQCSYHMLMSSMVNGNKQIKKVLK